MRDLLQGINLDLYSYCNAKCRFCAYSHMKRKRGAMSDEIFHKVIDEIATWEFRVRIVPYHYGDPLMNPKIFEQCDYISEKLPRLPIELSTNGSYLTKEIVDKLIRIKTLENLNFSVYAGTKANYESLTGLGFETLDFIEGTIERFRKERPDVDLCIGATMDERFVTKEDFLQLVERFGELVAPHAISFSYQHGNKEDMRVIPNSSPCAIPFQSSVVYWDGTVGVCCFDVDGELAVGDVTKTTLLDALNSDLAKKYRGVIQSGFKDVIPLCRSCTQPY